MNCVTNRRTFLAAASGGCLALPFGLPHVAGAQTSGDETPHASAAFMFPPSFPSHEAGATGALGRHAIDAFRDAGYRVRALARPSVRFEALRGVADEIFPANALQAEALIEPCKGTEETCGPNNAVRQARASKRLNHALVAAHVSHALQHL